MGLDAKELTLEEPQASLRNWQRKAVPIAIERLGDDLPIDRNDPVGPANFLDADRDDTPEKRHAGGSRPRVASREPSVAEGRTTSMPPATEGRHDRDQAPR